MALTMSSTKVAELAVKADKPMYTILSVSGGREKAAAVNGGSWAFRKAFSTNFLKRLYSQLKHGAITGIHLGGMARTKRKPHIPSRGVQARRGSLYLAPPWNLTLTLPTLATQLTVLTTGRPVSSLLMAMLVVTVGPAAPLSRSPSSPASPQHTCCQAALVSLTSYTPLAPAVSALRGHSASRTPRCQGSHYLTPAPVISISTVDLRSHRAQANARGFRWDLAARHAPYHHLQFKTSVYEASTGAEAALLPSASPRRQHLFLPSFLPPHFMPLPCQNRTSVTLQPGVILVLI
ncbi:hypothetical protein EYF80_011188 [Liparis tanakae]|uniref:Uncharacterized protein n=1 Tax=Liparis tanakae TaxID=230148 RepID=A0A4Z2IN57_9TELE|nr:hypothetical protein EYF80_011188 [Liparis tanakae]